MVKTEEFIEDRLKWKVSKNGLPNLDEFLFEKLNASEKIEIEKLLNSSEIGKPVLVFKADNGYSTIFGTKKVLCGIAENSNCVNYSDIVKHTVGDDPFGVFNPSQRREEFVKAEQNKILIKDKAGIDMTLHGPKGSVLFAMYNILLMMIKITSPNKD